MVMATPSVFPAPARRARPKDQLGHSSIKVTVDLYGHLVPGANRSAVDRLAAATSYNLAATDEENRDEDSGGSAGEDWSRRRELNPRPTDYELSRSTYSGYPNR